MRLYCRLNFCNYENNIHPLKIEKKVENNYSGYGTRSLEITPSHKQHGRERFKSALPIILPRSSDVCSVLNSNASVII